MHRVPQGRQRLAMGAVAVVAALAGVLVGIQIRATQAEDRRADLAAQEATAPQGQDPRQNADLEAERVARVRTVLDWAAAAQRTTSVLAAADAALVASQGRVTDDVVRQALAATVTELRALLASPPDPPEATDVAALVDITARVAAATTAVTDAQATWLAEQDAQDDAPEPSEFVARGWPYDGAAPDCGGPESYEPSRGVGFHTSVPTEEGDGSNGNVPRSAMTPLPWCTDALGNQQWLRTDAAEALIRLNEAFRARFGENIAIDLSYRSLADQEAMREALGSLAARPGTSNHGWGTAFDTWEWAAYAFGSPRQEWLVANAPAYGWEAPSWARQDGSSPEYWHFEYTG